MVDFNERTKLAMKVAREAGVEVSKIFNGEVDLETEVKEDNSPLTIADKASEKLIVDAIKSAFPDDSIISEEGSNTVGSSEYTWVIDPLDGTRNFAHGVPMYGVSIGCLQNGVPVIGAVYQPEIGKDGTLFVGELGKGAWKNGKQIHVSKTSDLSQSHFELWTPRKQELYPVQTQNLRNKGLSHKHLGSVSSELAYVASGGFDGFVYTTANYSLWDIVAGATLITEAGGQLSDFKGRDLILKEGATLPPIIATNGELHGQVLDNYNVLGRVKGPLYHTR